MIFNEEERNLFYTDTITSISKTKDILIESRSYWRKASEISDAKKNKRLIYKSNKLLIKSLKIYNDS